MNKSNINRDSFQTVRLEVFEKTDLLGSDTIVSGPTRFNIHRAFLIHYSRFFAVAIARHKDFHSPDSTIHLSYTTKSIEIFDIFANWLYTQNIDQAVTVPELLSLWILASSLEAVALREQIEKKLKNSPVHSELFDGILQIFGSLNSSELLQLWVLASWLEAPVLQNEIEDKLKTCVFKAGSSHSISSEMIESLNLSQLFSLGILASSLRLRLLQNKVVDAIISVFGKHFKTTVLPNKSFHRIWEATEEKQAVKLRELLVDLIVTYGGKLQLGEVENMEGEEWPRGLLVAVFNANMNCKAYHAGSEKRTLKRDDYHVDVLLPSVTDDDDDDKDADDDDDDDDILLRPADNYSQNL